MKRALVLAILLSSGIASADPTPEETERARTFFNAGAQAYSTAKYADAVRSFEQAYAITQRPPVLFSLAQAERKEFLDHGEPAMLKRALAHYKKYLEEVPSGGRRAEALDSKVELEARLARLDPAQANSGEKAEKRKPRVTVYSATPGAHATLDNGAPQELPYFADLEPGKHVVRVTAEGYFDADQEVSGDRGVDVPVSLTLRDKPALVNVATESGAEVYVDGRIVATTPVGRPIEVAPGGHIIAIVKNGKQAWSEDVLLERGKTFEVGPHLVTSGQRLLAWTMLGTGATTLVLGGVFALGSMSAEQKARDIEAKRAKENISSKELADHNKYIGQRDDTRTGAIVLGSIGAVATIGGLLFYAFDKPPVAVVPPRTLEPSKKPEAPIEITATFTPLLGPGLAGGGVVGRF